MSGLTAMHLLCPCAKAAARLNRANEVPLHPVRPCSSSRSRSRRPRGCHVTAASAGARHAAAGLAGAAAALGLLLPGSAAAMQPAALAPQPQEIALTASLLQQQQQPQAAGTEAAPACYGSIPTALAEAPDLVTDADVEAAAAAAAGGASPFCLDPAALEASLVSGLGWALEGAQEVTNFTESNFAAVGAPSTSMWLSNSPWCLMWDAYCNVLTTRPVATKIVTGMLGTFLGDSLAQLMQGLMNTHAAGSGSGSSGGGAGRRQRGSSGRGGSGAVSAARAGFELDVSRTARLVGFSALVGTPVAFVWFSLLDQYVLPADPTSPLAVFSKVALDQVLMAPVMTSIFFAAMTLLEGCRSPQQVVGTVKAKLKPTLLANWTVWPLAHVINFALVPPAQRILYINVVNIAWTAFMSHMASNGSEEAAAPAQQPAPAAARSKQLQQAGR